MLLRTEVVEYRENELEVRLTVSEATTLIGLRRTRLKVDQSKIEEGDPDRALLRVFTYPDLVAPVVETSGLDWPLDFESFAGLPEQLVILWEAAVYRLNPHWLPAGGDPQEKKVDPTPPTGS